MRKIFGWLLSPPSIVFYLAFGIASLFGAGSWRSFGVGCAFSLTFVVGSLTGYITMKSQMDKAFQEMFKGVTITKIEPTKLDCGHCGSADHTSAQHVAMDASNATYDHSTHRRPSEHDFSIMHVFNNNTGAVLECSPGCPARQAS